MLPIFLILSTPEGFYDSVCHIYETKTKTTSGPKTLMQPTIFHHIVVAFFQYTIFLEMALP